jgi:pimeloyl-ACP methyl ester carboxylesterase
MKDLKPMRATDSSAAAPTQFYTWNNYRCTYNQLPLLHPNAPDGISLLLIHPVGVGLSRKFWQRFCDEWYRTGQHNQIFNPDLLGCGESDMPRLAYHPLDWAKQLQYFLQAVVQLPVVLVVQGALLPVAIELVRLQPDMIQGLVLSGPPAWTLMSTATPSWKHRVNWNLFDSPLGNGFYRYARRSQFLRSFSQRQLFAQVEQIDAEWLSMLEQGASNPASRHAVFSFLAGFWRQDWSLAIAQIQQPTFVVFGEQASTITREAQATTPDEKLANYLKYLPKAEGVKIPGRNVLPYESTTAFVQAIQPFVAQLSPS